MKRRHLKNLIYSWQGVAWPSNSSSSARWKGGRTTTGPPGRRRTAARSVAAAPDWPSASASLSARTTKPCDGAASWKRRPAPAAQSVSVSENNNTSDF